VAKDEEAEAVAKVRESRSEIDGDRPRPRELRIDKRDCKRTEIRD